MDWTGFHKYVDGLDRWALNGIDWSLDELLATLGKMRGTYGWCSQGRRAIRRENDPEAAAAWARHKGIYHVKCSETLEIFVRSGRTSFVTLN